MRRCALFVVLLGVATAPATAVSLIHFEQITVAATAIGFTSTLISPAGLQQGTMAACRLETAQIRWTMDGTTPTTTVGSPLDIGDTVTVSGHDLMVLFRAIRTGSTSGVLNCHYTAP